MKIDFNVELLNVEGKPFEDTNMAKFLAGRLYSATKGDALKFLDWSLKLYQDGQLELDSSDHDTLIAFIKESDGVPRGIVGQLIKKVTSKA